jgi:hypothetical protein
MADRVGADRKFVTRIEPARRVFAVRRGNFGQSCKIHVRPAAGNQLQIKVPETNGRMAEREITFCAPANQHERLLEEIGADGGSVFGPADGHRQNLPAAARIEKRIQRFTEGTNRLRNGKGGLPAWVRVRRLLGHSNQSGLRA